MSVGSLGEVIMKSATHSIVCTNHCLSKEVFKAQLTQCASETSLKVVERNFRGRPFSRCRWLTGLVPTWNCKQGTHCNEIFWLKERKFLSIDKFSNWKFVFSSSKLYGRKIFILSFFLKPERIQVLNTLSTSSVCLLFAFLLGLTFWFFNIFQNKTCQKCFPCLFFKFVFVLSKVLGVCTLILL